MRILRALADNSCQESWANIFRRRRAGIFAGLINDLPRPLSILDLGGTEDFWVKTGLAEIPGIIVTLANITDERTQLPNFTALKANACNLSGITDAAFDIVFSNSVIEHVGSRQAQEQMAGEVQRVGKAFFVQTPAKFFPIEPHFMFPFFGVLPQSIRLWLVQNFALGWYPKQVNREQAIEFLKGFELLTLKDMQALFPSAKIIKERFCGLTKSYMAYGGFESLNKSNAPLEMLQSKRVSK